MSLTVSWKPFFQSDVRMRGRAYQLEGRVHLRTPVNGEVARAEVRGQSPYTVEIYDDGESATARCDCPHFAKGRYCKHIWATLLALESRDGLELSQPSFPRARKAAARRSTTRPQRRTAPWDDRLTLLRPSSAQESGRAATRLLPRRREVVYLLRTDLSQRQQAVAIELRHRSGSRRGLKPLKLSRDTVWELSDPRDRELCGLLVGARDLDEEGEASGRRMRRALFRLPAAAQRSMLRRIIETGRAVAEDREEAPVLQWRDEPWSLWLTGELGEETLEVRLEARRDEQRLTLPGEATVVGGPAGVLVQGGEAAPFDDHGAGRWIRPFCSADEPGGGEPMTVPLSDVERFLDRLYLLPELPRIDLPEPVRREARRIEPTPHLELFGSPTGGGNQAVDAEAWFDYDGERIDPQTPGRFIAHPVGGSAAEQAERPPLIRRDRKAERRALRQLAKAGLRESGKPDQAPLTLPARRVAQAVNRLARRGWVVQADRKLIRRGAAPRLAIQSGLDWFELRGGVPFQTEHGEQTVPLPEILRAARRGQQMIALDDGSQGMLPTDWLEQHGLLTAIGEVEDDHVRFRASQAALLDALLDERELVDVDEHFEQVRQRLRQFEGVREADPHPDFHGELRPYQREGLGWLEFLRWFGMGGILADDMGLGKTIQVLALLHKHYRGEESASAEQGEHRPSLVVAPKSVVFNWIDEAHRFTPDLRVVAYAGAERHELREQFGEVDLIVASYGLMPRDVEELSEHAFEYVILDEAQAIKNPSSQRAKAVRLIPAGHRLALTGTPVENHLGDLWSIFEFLNPGMLGSGARFSEQLRGGLEDPRNIDAARQVGQVLRPFILRRTKTQVLDDLPSKTEQTLVVEMDAAQRKIYDELRDHYRGTLLERFDQAGERVTGGKHGLVVLEALLRLRQAACHPALIDAGRQEVGSAKLEALIEQLHELIDEGHKALVFSQFTSMLALVRERLDAEGLTYEYLDGQTRDRKPRVERFQNDDSVPLFLMSLKAGGLGLNLTAADYVFILDPWWNPAAEAQAIDRTHRIGQTRHVFAYRLICRDTVEQRIIELQRQKSELAEAIVDGSEHVLRTMTRDDLERLLS